MLYVVKMAILSHMRVTVLVLVLKTLVVESFVSPGAHRSRIKRLSRLDASRRDIFSRIAWMPLVVATPKEAEAGIDPSALRNLPVEGDAGGSAMRMRQIEAVQRPESDLVNTPWEELPDGVQYREYREGKGEAGAYLMLLGVLTTSYR